MNTLEIFYRSYFIATIKQTDHAQRNKIDRRFFYLQMLIFLKVYFSKFKIEQLKNDTHLMCRITCIQFIGEKS